MAVLTRPAGRGRQITSLLSTLASLGVLAWLGAAHGDEIVRALRTGSPAGLLAATAAHAFTLVLRSEAWRLVLHSASAGRAPRSAIHGANAAAFLVGTVQSGAAVPARMALLRRMAAEEAPRLRALVLSDVPIFVLELLIAAVLLAWAGGGLLGLPVWARVAGAVATLAGVVALRLLYGRLRNRPLAAGLAVLGDAPRRASLAGVVLALTAVAVLRVWLVLLAFDLPHGADDAALVFVALGVLGLLPIGLAAGPGATFAVFGGGAMAATAGAGLLLSATSLLAVLLYAGVVGFVARAERERESHRPRGSVADEWGPKG